MQAVRFLQGLYGFVIHDFNYEAMQAYRDLARSAVVLAASLGRSGGLAPFSVDCVGTADSLECCQSHCNHLISSICNM